jgi:acetyl-CoA carboxylase carboxyl transferase subunit alpha
MLGSVLKKHLAELKAMPVDELVSARQQKFRNIAQFYTEGLEISCGRRERQWQP